MSIDTTRPIIIFSDLDATFLDHNTYSYDAALPVISHLKQEQILLVFVTSKTSDEVHSLLKNLNMDAPFIVENGGAIVIPKTLHHLFSSLPPMKDETLLLGKSYQECTQMSEILIEHFGIEPFHKMSVARVSALTGLNSTNAALAKTRACSEPFVLANLDERDHVIALAEKHDFTITQGGRFFHLMAKDQSKGKAIDTLLSMLKNSDAYQTIGLGDSPNDFSMLQKVDFPVLIPHKDGSFADLTLSNLKKASFPATKGWNLALKELLNVH